MMLFIVVLLSIVGIFAPVAEADTMFTAVIYASTYPVAGANAVPHLSDGLASTYDYEIYALEVYVDSVDQNQVVSFYDNNTSTTATTILWEVTISSGNSQATPYKKDFSDRNPLIAYDGLSVRKTTLNSAVKVNVLYK